MRLALRFAAILAALLLLHGGTRLYAERAEGSFERSLAVSGPVQLNVATGSGSISVRKGAAGSVRIQGRIRAGDRIHDGPALVREIEQNPPIRQTGNIVSIGSEVRKWEHVSISYDIAVPEEARVDARTGSGPIETWEVRGPLDSSTGSGGIRAENIGDRVNARTGSGGIHVTRAGGPVTAHTGSGPVQVSDVKGSVDAQTGSGDISVSGATGAVRARAGSGRVRVEKALGEVEAQSSSGGVTVDGAPKSARWELRSGSGSVHVSLPPGTPFELDAHTGSGTISTAHPLTVSGTFRRNELRGVAVRPDNRLYIRAGSGNVRVD